MRARPLPPSAFGQPGPLPQTPRPHAGRGSRLGTTSADAYARGHSAGDVGLDAQVKGKATRALPNMKANRDG